MIETIIGILFISFFSKWVYNIYRDALTETKLDKLDKLIYKELECFEKLYNEAIEESQRDMFFKLSDEVERGIADRKAELLSFGDMINNIKLGYVHL